jgi:hypothetical protein
MAEQGEPKRAKRSIASKTKTQIILTRSFASRFFALLNLEILAKSQLTILWLLYVQGFKVK